MIRYGQKLTLSMIQCNCFFFKIFQHSMIIQSFILPQILALFYASMFKMEISIQSDQCLLIYAVKVHLYYMEQNII